MKRASLALLLLLVAACSTTTTTTPPSAAPKSTLDMKDARRIVGTENDVRIDAEVYGDTLSSNANIPIKYEITNNRSSSILVADLIPQATYDPDTLTVTVNIGSEIPGEQFLPRLISIPSGGKKSFTGAAHVSILQNPNSTPFAPRPRALQIRVNFLGNTTDFAKLIDIPEKAVHDPTLAASLFTKWVEQNETVVTNTLPMRWKAAPIIEDSTPAVPAPRRRRGGG